ncbi:DUF2213 domain-containing protein [Falsochrobactrum sp. TDYN1]|uniref:DUF2213 domain-containing protein n=1 Tax=Falsochrobactrum tianjinense TaxID=2706015 RepID=A0A949PPV6_9HYPH|nr:DUF2213 domain-containing protein [Falsochrobactrum sp. TDYN1]MBV2144235.1 DUF2213 domain-containing protein [Falsochrobactrum sp. TDYN1]
MKITDTVTLDASQVNDDGYLVANARTARIGIQQYLGPEIGRPDLGVVNVYRDEAEVFSKRSLDTFSRIPITLDHPDDVVTADNWKQYAVGTTGDEVLRDGEYLKIGLKITDADAVKAVKDGKRELSVGYAADLVWADGVAPDGTPYQAKQTGISANHIAIVSRGRAGSQARIGDGASWGIRPFSSQTADERKSPMADTLRKVLVDGLQVETTDAGATAIEKLTADKAAVEKKLSDAETAHGAAIATKDAELAKKDAEIDDLKGKVLDGAALDAAVAARGDLLNKARAIAPDVKTDGLSDAAIRKAVVEAKLGDAVKDKAEAYIDARFDILAEDAAGTEQLRDTLTNLKPTNDAGKAQQSYVDRMTKRSA